MSSPPTPLSSFLTFFLSLFLLALLFDRAAGFLPPRPRIVAAGARRFCQGWPLFSGHPSGAPAFTAIEHDGRLDGSGRFTPVCYFRTSGVSARYSDHGCCLRQVLLRGPWRVRCSHQLISGSSDPACQGAACMDDRAGGMGLIFRTADRQVPICDADPQSHIRPARHTRLGVSELSALSTLSCEGRSLRNQTLLEIAPEGNGELARHCNDHDALNAPVLPFGPLHEPLGNRALGLVFDP